MPHFGMNSPDNFEVKTVVNQVCQPIRLLGVQIHPLTVVQLHNLAAQIINAQAKALVLNVNVYAMNLAYEQQWMRDFLNAGEIVFCDGFGVRLGAYLQGKNIPVRITYADWMWQFSEYAASCGYTFYFLGAQPGVANKAALLLNKQYPLLKILGTHHGYFEKTLGSPENEAVIEEINRLSPNILVMGFGMPLQERWLMENWGRLNVNIALTGGAVFDYISGELKRGPEWMTDNGFEWLARLIIEPRRLWQRYILGNPIFIWRILKQKLGGF